MTVWFSRMDSRLCITFWATFLCVHARILPQAIAQGHVRTFEVTNGDTAFFVAAERFVVMSGDTINRIDAQDMAQGNWTHTFTDGTFMCSGYYKDGRKDGYWEKRYPNGAIRYRINLKNGYLHGPCSFYYPNGVLREAGTFRVGLGHGSFRKYASNGQLASVEEFRIGRSHGVVSIYAETGKLIGIGRTSRGEREGIWRFVDPEKNSILEVLYRGGRTISFDRKAQ